MGSAAAGSRRRYIATRTNIAHCSKSRRTHAMSGSPKVNCLYPIADSAAQCSFTLAARWSRKVF
jgi:hypothetical protein